MRPSKARPRALYKVLHGHTRRGQCSPTYRSWKSMMCRCHSPKSDLDNCYLARGIKVCDKWLKFQGFLSDMGIRPEGTSLDRKDNNLGYYKENCRWANADEQARNRRNTKLDYNKALEIATKMLNGGKATIIAKEYNISESVPREIYKGRAWKDAFNAAKDKLTLQLGRQNDQQH